MFEFYLGNPGQVLLQQRAEVSFTGKAFEGRTRRCGLDIDISSNGPQTGGVDEPRQRDLAKVAEFSVAGLKAPHVAVGGNLNTRDTFRDGDGRFESRAIHVPQDQIAVAVLEKVAGSRVTGSRSQLFEDIDLKKPLPSIIMSKSLDVGVAAPTSKSSWVLLIFDPRPT